MLILRVNRCLLALTLFPLLLNGCDKSTPSAAAVGSSNYDYHVNPSLTNEQSKRVPELLIVNENAECLHYSTGYAAGHFLESIDKMFTHQSDTSAQLVITAEMRDEFKKRYPEQVTQVTQNLKASRASITDEELESALNRIIDSAIEQEASAYTEKQIVKNCDQHLDEHLSWIVDSNGNPVTREQVLKPDVLTVLQYRNDDCADCVKQQADIDNYTKSRHQFVNYIFIERNTKNL